MTIISNGEPWKPKMSENDIKIDDMMERLGFCNCGRPEDALRSIKRCLEAHADDNDMPYPITECEWVIVYYLEREGYLEHGSNISAAWRTDHGDLLLQQLEEIEL